MIHGSRGLRRKTLVMGAAGAALLLFAAVALAGSSFKNGGFETGDFTEWTTDSTATSGGQWFVSNKRFTPLNGFSWKGPIRSIAVRAKGVDT
jgi:hypothetical protein